MSVNNELVQSFPGCKLTIRILNQDMSEAYHKSVSIDTPADRLMKDVVTISLPRNLSPVHFIHMDIMYERGNTVAQNFYWRSNKEYKPGRTLPGASRTIKVE